MVDICLHLPVYLGQLLFVFSLEKTYPEILDICNHNHKRKIEGHIGNTIIFTSYFREKHLIWAICKVLRGMSYPII